MLWDGDCGFCARAAEFAERFNTSGFILVPYQSISEEELRLFHLTHHQCERELKTISASGRAYGGAFAVNHFLWHNPKWRTLIVLLYLIPISILAEVLVYTAIASNRYLIARVLGMDACSIQDHKRKENS